MTHDELKRLLSYDPGTGEFVRLAAGGKRATRPDRVGLPAGSLCRSSGYVLVSVAGRRYRAHRLAWFYMTGSWPADQIDHKNRDRADNRWANLRPATNTENSRNTGARGFWRNGKRWRAGIVVDRRQIHLGYFDTAAEAAAAYRAAKGRYHAVPAGGGR